MTVDPGSTLLTACNLGTLNVSTINVPQSVNALNDRTDYYRFTLNRAGSVSLSLSGMSADADLVLRRSNGIEIASSRNAGSAPDSISRTLDPGTYYIEVFAFRTSNTAYNLAVSRSGPASDPANNFGSAYDFGRFDASGRFRRDTEQVSQQGDMYRFNVAERARINIALTGMTRDADLYLYNANGAEIALSNRSGAVDDAINRILEIGTYYVQVRPYASGGTAYSLAVSGTELIGGVSNLLPREFDAGTLPGIRSYRDAVNPNDHTDTYRFYLSSGRTFSAALSGMSADADMRLIADRNGNGIVDSGEVVVSSTLGGTNTDRIAPRYLGPGSYFLQVYSFAPETSTNYRLDLSAL